MGGGEWSLDAVLDRKINKINYFLFYSGTYSYNDPLKPLADFWFVTTYFIFLPYGRKFGLNSSMWEIFYFEENVKISKQHK